MTETKRPLATLNGLSKTLKAIHHRGTESTEVYFVSYAVGAVNNKELSLCSLCLCGGQGF